MAKRPLFSTYRQGENRVTGSTIAVFERLDIGTLERLLGAAVEDSALSLVDFGLLRPVGSESVPDASINANFNYLFEVKIHEGAVRRDQIADHLALLDGTPHQDKRLFVLTPDSAAPAALGDFGDNVCWISFLSEAIDGVLASPIETVSERERYLLRELQALYVEEGLIGRADTVVVAAERAYAEYLRLSAYICQPNRPFRKGLERLGFYRRGEIQPHFPAILHRRDEVLFAPDEVERLRATGDSFDERIADLIQVRVSEGRTPVGRLGQFFLLSGPEDEATFRLSHSIRHLSDGPGSAWTQNQRYVVFEVIEKEQPRTTVELAAKGGLTARLPRCGL